jgi:hypothetical protein
LREIPIFLETSVNIHNTTPKDHIYQPQSNATSPQHTSDSPVSLSSWLLPLDAAAVTGAILLRLGGIFGFWLPGFPSRGGEALTSLILQAIEKWRL